MICRAFIDSIPGYLELELSHEARRRFEAHAEGCSSCSSYLASYRQTIRLAREAFDDPDEERSDREALPELLRAVLGARRPPEG